MTNRVVKFDNKYYETIIDDNGIKLVPIDEQKYLDIAAEKALLEEVDVSENNIIQDVVDKVQDELLTSLQNNIRNAALRILGFSDRWGRWEVDHCNGRMSDLSNLLANKAKEELLKLTIGDLRFTSKEITELQAAARKDYLECYERNLRNKLRDNALKHAEETLQDIVDQTVKERTKVISDLMLDKILTPKK